MRKILFAAIMLPVTLSSCFWEKGVPSESSVSGSGVDIRQTLSSSGRNAAIAELPGYLPVQEKIERDAERDRLSTLTSENLGTMVAAAPDAWAPKRLENRTLFLNYLKGRDIRSPGDALQGIADVGAFAARENVSVTEADLMVLLAGLRIGKPGVDICAWIEDLSDAEKDNRYYPYLVRTCRVPQ